MGIIGEVVVLVGPQASNPFARCGICGANARLPPAMRGAATT